MTDAAYPPICGLSHDRLTLFRDQLVSVQSGHATPYDPDDVMTFIATTSRVLLALVTDLLGATCQL